MSFFAVVRAVDDVTGVGQCAAQQALQILIVLNEKNAHDSPSFIDGVRRQSPRAATHRDANRPDVRHPAAGRQTRRAHLAAAQDSDSSASRSAAS
jgi:hypothetical protein